MEEFKNLAVFLPDDRADDPALATAIRLAQQNGAKIKVIDVMPQMPSFLSSLLFPSDDADRAARLARRETLEELVISYERTTGLDFSVEVLSGPTALELTREVIRGEHDLLLKTARNSDKENASLGTVALRLARFCPCPVWVINKSSSGQAVLATIDIASERPSDERLNRHILRLAASLAEFEGVKLDALYVHDPKWTLVGGHHADSSHLRDVERRVWAKVKERLDFTMDGAGVSLEDQSRHLVSGLPLESILEFTRVHGTGTVVMGSVGRNGLTGFLIGNTAEAVLRRIQCSVLTVKPEGFVSPVQLED